MKWLVVTCFLLWARHGEGGAIKCVAELEDAPCSSEQQEVIDPQEIVTDAAIPTSSSEDSSEAECLAGSEWESNCHSCRCSSDGTATCLKQSSCDSPITEPIRCKPNTTFDRECNTCTCLENGLGLCTLKNCQRIPARVPSKADLPKGSDCAPGGKWKSGCSDCECTPEGLRLCSSVGCPEGLESEPLLRCAPHSLWKKECNTCWCTSDGRAMCTKIGCVGIPTDMHFSDEDNESESLEVVESEIISKEPNVPDDILLGSEIKNQNDNVDDPATELDDNNLTGVILKEFIDYDNDVETPIKDLKADYDSERQGDMAQVETSFTDRKTPEENYHILKNTAETDESEVMMSEELKELETSYINNNINVKPNDPKGLDTDLEDLESQYNDHNIQEETHHIIKRSVCKPNQDFQSECNTCKCSATGQSYACTQNECMDKDKEDVDKEVEVFMETEGEDHIERHSVCKPSITFYVDCNPCQCNGDGTDFSCTNKPCPLPEDVEIINESNEMKPIVPLKSGGTTSSKIPK